ncbi:hypothetical protein NQ317_009367 [Molorchus minor]|uniref:Cilia- and flagella-associated protein 61 N-terminal domain-containing protein n=1 Tax=Molorchus minor TaxID=1323400 RepID=A0ABQ9JQ25_9CUCU|nr:hypothetical protein NQ317_009367 [Molorchus minor]
MLARKCIILLPDDVTRMVPEHARRAEKLITKATYALFGDIDIDDILTHCFAALQLEDEEGKLAGVVVLNVYPNVPAIPQWEWESWLHNLYGLESVTTHNTIWICLALWDACYYYLFLKPIVHRMFQIRNYVHNIMMVLPPGATKIEFLGDLGTRVLPKDCTNPKTCQTLYLMKRQDFLMNYKLRRAVEEDNDDLVPLISTHSKRLEELYGKFYIAELLTRHKDTGRQIIVAEYNEVAVAVVCLNETVNYKVLNEEFEMTPFNGLKKPHPDDPDLTLDVLYPSIEPLPFSSNEEVLQIVERKSFESGLPISEHDVLIHVTTTSSDDYSLVFTSNSIFVFQDDDDKHSPTMEDQDLISEFGDILSKIPKLPELPDYDTMSVCTVDVAKPKSVIRVPKFLGEGNAFSIEIAVAQPQHEQGLMKLFESSFHCFPEKDYAIMSIPSLLPANKLTDIFVRAVPLPSGTFPYELFILHKNAVLGLMRVDPATHGDEEKVKHLISSIPNNYQIMQQYDNYLHDRYSPYLVYVMTCDGQSVGVAILSEEYDVDYLEAHYDILYCADPKMYKSGCHGLLDSLVMSPIFHNHANFFLRELHRQSDFSIIYYKHSPYDSSHYYRERPLINLLHTLFPIMPRQQQEYDPEILKDEECEISPSILEKKGPYALYVSTMPKCSVSRYTVNTRIVVIGATHTALAFLESLVLSQTPRLLVTFNNVTLVGNHSISHYRVSPRLKEAFIVKKYFVDHRHLEMVSLRNYINYVQGRMTKIDRKEQLVVVNETSMLYYDLLFLMCGESFSKPKKKNNVSVTEEPCNIFIVNDATDVHNAVVKLKQMYNANIDEEYQIIVYGHFLDAYCTLNGLLTYGIPGNHIIFIEPFPFSMEMEKRQRHNVSIFNDPEVDQVVLDEMKAQGITVYCSYYFVDWEYDEEENVVTAVKFESRHKILELECMAMFYFHNKGVVPRVYRVINEAGLVFDGRLVIDKKCRTNDHNIYGAGTLTKYSRKYYASHMIHKYFNRMEIGYRLGQQIKKMLVPQQIIKLSKQRSSWNFDMERGAHLVPRYEKPVMRHCRLPGGLHYLSVVKPGRRIPLETALSMENYGHFLITGNCTNLQKQGYFKLHLNQFHRVETITCLTKFPIDVHNIYSLWGKHERLLNNLQLRFEMGVITDLFEYFKQPWTYAIYHDRFDALLDDLNSLMTSTMFNTEVSLVSEFIDMYKETKWKELPQNEVDRLEEEFTALTYPKILEQKVLEFIHKNLDHLPMYAHPIVVKAILAGYRKSPLFSK